MLLTGETPIHGLPLLVNGTLGETHVKDPGMHLLESQRAQAHLPCLDLHFYSEAFHTAEGELGQGHRFLSQPGLCHAEQLVGVDIGQLQDVKQCFDIPPMSSTLHQIVITQLVGHVESPHVLRVFGHCNWA